MFIKYKEYVEKSVKRQTIWKKENKTIIIAIKIIIEIAYKLLKYHQKNKCEIWNIKWNEMKFTLNNIK